MFQKLPQGIALPGGWRPAGYGAPLMPPPGMRSNIGWRGPPAPRIRAPVQDFRGMNFPTTCDWLFYTEVTYNLVFIVVDHWLAVLHTDKQVILNNVYCLWMLFLMSPSIQTQTIH